MKLVNFPFQLEGEGPGIIMEVTRPLLLRLFYQVKWPITPNKSAGSVEMNKSDFKMDLALFTDLLSFFLRNCIFTVHFMVSIVMFECCLSQGAITLGLKFLLIFFSACSKSFKYDSCLKSCFIGSNHLLIKVFFAQLGVEKR